MKERQISIGKGFLITALSVLFIFSCFMIAKPKEVEAASSYKAISFEFDEIDKPVKVKGYYFKYKNNELYISKKKSSGYKNTKITSHDAWTNGKSIYYTDYDTCIYKYTISNKKHKEVADLYKRIVGRYGYIWISKVYKNKIYLSVYTYYDDSANTYYYDTKTKKTKKVKSNTDILASSGKYCVCQNDISATTYAKKLTLYKLTSSGKFKKIKTLTKKGYPYVKVVDGKFYYMEYSKKKSLKKASVYRIKTNGKSKKKMITISEKFEFRPYRFSKKSCKVFDWSNNIYKYPY